MIKIYRYGEIGKEEVFARISPMADVEDAVAEIIANVRKRGDEALYGYSLKFDKAELSYLEVTEKEMKEALETVDPSFLEILKKAEANIRAFHEKQKRTGFIVNEQEGIVLGQKVIPIEKAGIYVPGGTAAYPSTVLMDAVPAKTPPMKDGKVNPDILSAASVAGVDRIFKVGGAQAIAALAYGTESIPKVDKIVGPGNS